MKLRLTFPFFLYTHAVMAHRPSPSLSLPRLAGHLDVNYCTINLLVTAAIIFSDSPVQRPRRLVVRKD